MKKALLVIDFQNGVCKNGNIYNYKNIITNINNQIDKFHLNNNPVIFIQHEDRDLIHGSFEWNLISDLHNNDNDYYVEKIHADFFYKTNLHELLKHLHIDGLQICGAQVEYCIDTTIKVAHNLGYQLTMTHNSVTTFDNEYLKADKMINFYEDIWNNRFLDFIE